MENIIKVGVGIMVLKDDKVLLGKRKNAHGENEYGFPGGHLEYMESFRDCAVREINEECGIQVKNIDFLFLMNLKSYALKHYCHIGLVAEWESGIPQILEPEKCDGWDWYSLDALPDRLFEPCKYSIESYKTGKKYFDL